MGSNIKDLDPLSEIKALAEIITSSIADIETSLKDTGRTYPSPHIAHSRPESESGRNILEVQIAGAKIVAAASQLIATVRPPPLTMIANALQYHLSTAIRIAIVTHTVEILRDAGPKGKHVQEIAKPTNVDPTKLARVLRLLATNHIFVEVSPDVFANNRLSSVLDTGKNWEIIVNQPADQKYEGGIAFAALLEHFIDEGFKSSSALVETILPSEDGLSKTPYKTAFNRAFKTDSPFFDWVEHKEQKLRLTRFAAGFAGGSTVAASDTILDGFAWTSYPEGSIVVDVGGGVGSQSLAIAKAHPQLSLIVQDRAPVTLEGIKLWKQELPGHLESGRALFESHDFFDRQPPRKVSVFLLRMILHDWPTEDCVKILKHLRAAADNSTRLLIVDNIISYACHETQTKDICGALRLPPQKPLLPNLGQTSVLKYYADLNMMTLLDGQERTVLQLNELLERCSWKLIEVSYGDSFSVSQSKAIAVPM